MSEATEEVEVEVEVKEKGVLYVGKCLSSKELKLRILHSTTPEQPKIWADMMPKPVKRYK